MKQIHYGDTIFYLQTLMKAARSGLSLNIDTGFFREKMLEDILFIGSYLGKVYTSLKANTRLIKKADYIRGLLRAKRDYIALVDDILAGNLPFAAEIKAGFPKLKMSRAEEAATLDEITGYIEKRGQEDSAAESELISGEEFRFLLDGDADGAG